MISPFAVINTLFVSLILGGQEVESREIQRVADIDLRRKPWRAPSRAS